MNITVKKGKGDFHKKLKQLRQFGKAHVEVGHFASQGQHESIDMSYVDLMKFHHKGGVSESGVSSPSRPVMTHMMMYATKAAANSMSTRQAFKAWSEGRTTNEGFFISLGKVLVQTEKNLFGSSGSLVKNAPFTVALKGRDDPLVDTGDLRDRVAYKTSISKRVVDSA